MSEAVEAVLVVQIALALFAASVAKLRRPLPLAVQLSQAVGVPTGRVVAVVRLLSVGELALGGLLLSNLLAFELRILSATLFAFFCVFHAYRAAARLETDCGCAPGVRLWGEGEMKAAAASAVSALCAAAAGVLNGVLHWQCDFKVSLILFGSVVALCWAAAQIAQFQKKPQWASAIGRDHQP